jgi:hypothetical protein
LRNGIVEHVRGNEGFEIIQRGGCGVMNNLQRLGGVAALSEAAIYVLAFLLYGTVLASPVGVSVVERFQFLSEHQAALSILNFTMYVVFGVILVVLVMALDERLKEKSPVLSRAASVFGFLWVGLVIASGMIANIGLATALEVFAKNPDQAQSAWVAITAVVEGLGGGNEIVGGLWVLILSSAALRGSELPKALGYLGLFVGGAGVLTVYPAEVFTEVFGLSQIAWFVWLGGVMLRKS